MKRRAFITLLGGASVGCRRLTCELKEELLRLPNSDIFGSIVVLDGAWHELEDHS